MDAAQLRDLGNQCHAAADQLQDSHTRGVSVTAGSFNWKQFFAGIVQLLPEILALFGGKTPNSPTPQS